MKNRKLLLLLPALIAGPLSAEIIPYLPVKVSLEEVIGNQDFFNVNLDSNFTIEFESEGNTSVRLCNSELNGIEYDIEIPGKYRFANNEGKINVYRDNKFVEQKTISSLEFPELFAENDSRENLTGIYSVSNLFGNPGFEDIVEGGAEANNQYIPAIWECTNFYTGTRSRVNTNYQNNLSGLEGRGALMHHGYTDGEGKYFFQKIDGDKFSENNKYRVQFRTWSHSNAYGKYTARIGYSANDNSLAEYSWSQTSTAYNCKDQTFDFVYNTDGESKDIYFTVERIGETIGHFDRMLMFGTFEDAPSSSGIYAENIANISYDASGAFAPVVIMDDNDYYDLTSYINDAAVTSASAWSGGTVEIKSGESFAGAPDSYYLDKWNSSGFTYDAYQNIKDLPTGKYMLTAAVRANSDDFYVYAECDSRSYTTPIINNGNTDGELGIGWNRVEIQDIIVKNGEMKIGVGGTTADNGRWLSVDDFRLYYFGADNSILKETLLELIEDAKKFDLSSVPSGIAQELADAIKAAEEVADEEEAIREAEVVLLDKLSRANSYVVYYVDLDYSIRMFESLENRWFTTIIAEARNIYELESPTLDEIKNAHDQLLGNVVSIMDNFSGYNYTGKIVNPTVDSESGWTFENVNGQHKTITGQHYTYDEMNRYLDSWNSTAGALDYNAYQIVELPENGLYILSAAARASGAGGFIYANDVKREIPANGDVDGELGEGWSFVRVPVVVTDGTLKLGVRTIVDLWTGKWISADDFTLTKYPYDDIFLSVEEKETESVRIYSENGRIRVEGRTDFSITNISGMNMPQNMNLAKGLYFVTVDNRTYNVIVR